MAYGTIAADVITGTNGNTFSPESSVFRNRIINGAMVIDQRNAGASVTATTAFEWFTDRWQSRSAISSKFSGQQNAGSVTPPAGFSNYLGMTSLSAYSVISTSYYLVRQPIEGFNTSDLNFGTANAKTITLSFWVRSSLTGTFAGGLRNSANNRSYVFTFTISSANTWEYKTITIAGDTTGTWIGATNGIGMEVLFNMGAGSDYQGTANTWNASGAFSTSSAVNMVGTNGATFYITGVQLEVGSTATSFDYRPYGTELQLCQRYLPAWSFPTSTVVSPTFVYSTTTSGPVYLTNPVAVRTPVTGITVSAASNFSVSDGDSGTACDGLSIQGGGTLVTALNWSTASGRTAFRPHNFYTNTTNAFILGTGCEL